MKKIPNFKIPTKEEIKKMRKRAYYDAQCNKENLSYWFPHIYVSKTRYDTNLKLPETMTVTLSYDRFMSLKSDNLTDEVIKDFNDYILRKVSSFEEGKPLFMKSGVFSNKFNFSDAIVTDRNNIGRQFYDNFYTSLCLGVPLSAEVVFRELIEDKEDTSVIYNGMPLHTEFRVFFDFDVSQIVGVANYWHPDLMKNYLSEHDRRVYLKEEDRILADFNKYKNEVSESVSYWMQGVNGLEGKWSIDVMKNGDDFWIIDMARMERSALQDKYEVL